MMMRREALVAALVVVSSLACHAAIGRRARASELGIAMRSAVGSLPKELNGPAVSFMEDYDGASFNALVSAVDGYVSGDVRTLKPPQTFDGDWGSVDQAGLKDAQLYEAAEKIETLYVVLKPVLARPENENALRRFLEARIQASRHLKNAGYMLAMVRERIRQFSDGKPSSKLEQSVGLVLADPGAPTVTPLPAHLKKPKRSPGGLLAQVRVPEPLPWQRYGFSADAMRDWIERLSTRSAGKTDDAGLPELDANAEDNVAGMPSVPTEQARRFIERFPRGAVRGADAQRYVAFTSAAQGPIVNLDPQTVLLLGPEFSSNAPLFSAGRIFVIGAQTDAPIVSNDAVVFDASSRANGLVRAPKVFLAVEAHPGAGASIFAQELGAFAVKIPTAAAE